MNRIHPTAMVSEEVVLGDGNTIGPLVVISGPVVLGDDNWIGTGVVIGAPPEVRSFVHPRAANDPAGYGVVIGNRNTIREYAQIHQGLKSETTVGNDTFVMNQCYIAHDSTLGDGVTLASSVLLAGHVRIGDGANLGLGVAVHQFCEVGRGSMVGMGSIVVKEVPPFAKAYGSPASIHGANLVGMERSGISAAIVQILSDIYGGHAATGSGMIGAGLDVIDDEDVRIAVDRWAKQTR